MKLIAEYKIISKYRSDNIDSSWKRVETDFEKVSLFNKPRIQIRNLGICIKKKRDHLVVCKLESNVALRLDFEEQKNLIKNEEDNILYRNLVKDIKNYGKYTESHNQLYFFEFPVMTSKIAYYVNVNDFEYHYIFYLIE